MRNGRQELRGQKEKGHDVGQAGRDATASSVQEQSDSIPRRLEANMVQATTPKGRAVLASSAYLRELSTRRSYR